jgi:hypothetical protein
MKEAAQKAAFFMDVIECSYLLKNRFVYLLCHTYVFSMNRHITSTIDFSIRIITINFTISQ